MKPRPRPATPECTVVTRKKPRVPVHAVCEAKETDYAVIEGQQKAAMNGEESEQQAYAEGFVSGKACIQLQRGHHARLQMASFL